VIVKLSFDEVVASLKLEREFQDAKYGSIDNKQQSVAGYLLVLEAELNEAKTGWLKNVEGKHSSLAEIRQIAAVAIACLQQHGFEGNPL
jgi:hypothetical protein